MGTKYCGHDSALCVLDTTQKKIFAISTERVTRIKHDSIDITPIINAYDFKNIDFIAHSYSDFEDKGHDGELREKMTYTKDIEKALRRIIKPNYIADLNLSRVGKTCLFLSHCLLIILQLKNITALNIKDLWSEKLLKEIKKHLQVI